LIVPAFDQYSMPVPSGKANSIRPPESTSSIAYSSATRFGYARLTGTPATRMRARLVFVAIAAPIRLTVGVMLYVVL
jgi:hypothetical protein